VKDGSEILDEIMEHVSVGDGRPAVPKAKGLRGQGGIYKRGNLWWIRYSHNGKEIRESSESDKPSVAERLLKKRQNEIARGKFVGVKEERCTVAQLLDAVEQDHKLNGRRAVDTLSGRVATLKDDLGDMRAVDVRAKDVAAYTARRLAGKSKRGTTPSVALVNRELALLRRAFNLGVEQERLATAPHIKLLSGERAREGFVEPATFEAIAQALPEPLSDVARLAYTSGWRKQEILSLEWAHVDMANGLIRLARENSKTGEPRLLVLSGALLALMERRQAAQLEDCPWVFHRKGKRIDGLRKAWAKATKAAGVPGLLFHDLRRSACRNMSRAGVPQAVAMKISGHQTDSMFRRYRIVDEADIARALSATQAFNEAKPNAAQGDPI